MNLSYRSHLRQIQFSTNNLLQVRFPTFEKYSDVDAILNFTWHDNERMEENSDGDIVGTITFDDKVNMVHIRRGKRGHEVQIHDPFSLFEYKFFPETVRFLPVIDLICDDEDCIDFIFRAPKFGIRVHANRAFRVKWSLPGWRSSDTKDDNCFTEEYKQLYGTWNRSYKTKDGIRFCTEPITPDVAHIPTLN